MKCATAAAPARLDADERKAIAAEVAIALGRDAKAPAEEAAAPSPSPEAAQAREEADQLLDRARAAGEWTDENARSLRQLLVTMTDPDRQTIVRALIQTINAQQLAMRTHGPPF